MCVLYAAHSREVTPFLSLLLVSVCFRTIAVYLTGDTMLSSSYPVVGQCRPKEAYCLLNTAWSSILPICDESCFVWLGFIMMICKTIKGKTQRLWLLLLCNSSEMLKFTCRGSKKARIS